MPGTLHKLIHLSRVPLLISNWPAFFVNYLGLRNTGGTYCLRDGTVIQDKEGLVTGTIAVVYLRREYGDVSGKQIIVDLGANVGVFSLYAAAQCPQARLYCYEPSPKNISLLKSNVEQNGLADRVTICEKAIASRRERRRFIAPESPLSRLDEGKGQEECESAFEVECITLADIFDEHSLSEIDFLKMNCEGAEYEILESASDDVLSRIREIRLEYHEIDNKKQNGAALARLLEQRGFRIVRLKHCGIDSGFLWAMRNEQ